MNRALIASHLAAGLLSAMGLATVSSHAQVANAEQLLACQEITVSEERLRCFDAVLADPQDSRDQAPTELSDSRVTTAVSEEPAEQVAEPTNTDEELIAQFGASDLPAEKDEEALKELRAVVTHYEETRSGRQMFTLENGQVWRQISGDRRSLYIPRRRDEPLEVIIKPGALGSHSLRLTTAKRTIKVERIL